MARYRNVRTDWHSHPKTVGLSPLARDLCSQAWESALSGILERSVRRMATEAGGTPRRPTTVEDVEDAIAELVERGIAMWWPDMEILWVIEAADEQAKGAKAWEGVEGEVCRQPGAVRAAFASRYWDRLSDRLRAGFDRSPDRTSNPILDRISVSPLPDPETVPDPAPVGPTRARDPDPSTDSPRGPDPRAELRKRAAQIGGPAGEKALLAEWRTYGGDPEGLGPWPKPKPPHGPELAQLTLAKVDVVLAHGRTALELHRLVHDLGRMIVAGAYPPTEHRAQYVFSGYFESVEQRVAEWRERISDVRVDDTGPIVSDDMLAAFGGGS